jgi:hypothetical protein
MEAILASRVTIANSAKNRVIVPLKFPDFRKSKVVNRMIHLLSLYHYINPELFQICLQNK